MCSHRNLVIGQWDRANITASRHARRLSSPCDLQSHRLPRWLDSGFRVEFYIKTVSCSWRDRTLHAHVWRGRLPFFRPRSVLLVTFAHLLGRHASRTRSPAGGNTRRRRWCGRFAAIAIAGAVGAKKDERRLRSRSSFCGRSSYLRPAFVAQALQLPRCRRAWIGTRNSPTPRSRGGTDLWRLCRP